MHKYIHMCDVQSASTLNPGDSSNLLKFTVDATWVGSLERGRGAIGPMFILSFAVTAMLT